MCVSVSPMIVHSVFMTIGCWVTCENVTSFEQTSSQYASCHGDNIITYHHATSSVMRCLQTSTYSIVIVQLL